MGNSHIGPRIQIIRESKNLTQEQLVEKIGLSSWHISAIERGVKSPKIETLISIINELGCSADEVFYEVIDNIYDIKSSILSDKILDLPYDEQRRIFSVVEAMINGATKN